MNQQKKFCILSIALLGFVACTKSSGGNIDTDTLNKNILSDVSSIVITTSYEDMYAKSTSLSSAVAALIGSTNSTNLTNARQAWKNMRMTWEQSEAWLFGPVSANDIDPRIDTWPVDFNALNAELANGHAFTPDYIDVLAEDLKGFHPIEYLLWGQNGTKVATDFTDREKEYLQALTDNLTKLSEEVKDSWTTGGYAHILKTAGDQGNTSYPSIQSAFIEIADAMEGICDEVANGKMHEPFITQDASKEESPFAKNSITDFTNNIQGILKMYQGKFSADGKGIEDLVRHYNLSLDNAIKTQHAAAIAALQTITDPFGQAIFTQPIQIQNAMDKINDLAHTLRTKLKPFLQQYAR